MEIIQGIFYLSLLITFMAIAAHYQIKTNMLNWELRLLKTELEVEQGLKKHWFESSQYWQKKASGCVYSAKRQYTMTQPVKKVDEYPPYTLEGGVMSELEYKTREGLPYGSN